MSDPPLQDLRAPPGRRARLTGIALFCAALLCFACLDAVAKQLNTSMDTLQVVWARYASAFLLALLFINPFTRPGLTRTHRLPLQLGRSLLLLVCTALNFFALRYLQLDQTIAINFSTPLFIALLAGPLLGEWIGVRRWAAILVGFTGVLVVTRPGFGGIHWAAALSVASAVFYATYNIATRLLARTDSSETTLFYSNLVGFVVMTFLLPWVWTTPASAGEVALMLMTGALGALGHYLLIVAHRFAPAAILAPFIYTQMLWMVALGYLVFAQSPGPATLLGGAIVIASGLYLLYKERRS